MGDFYPEIPFKNQSFDKLVNGVTFEIYSAAKKRVINVSLHQFFKSAYDEAREVIISEIQKQQWNYETITRKQAIEHMDYLPAPDVFKLYGEEGVTIVIPIRENDDVIVNGVHIVIEKKPLEKHIRKLLEMIDKIRDRRSSAMNELKYYYSSSGITLPEIRING
jgi:hypothetical protein